MFFSICVLLHLIILIQFKSVVNFVLLFDNSLQFSMLRHIFEKYSITYSFFKLEKSMTHRLNCYKKSLRMTLMKYL